MSIPAVRRLCLEHDDLGFLEQAAGLLGYCSRMVQLESGANPSRMEVVDVGSVSLVRLRFSRRTFVEGSKPAGRIFCNLTLQPVREPPRAHGVDLSPDTLVGLDAGREIYFQAPGGHRFAALLIDAPLFWQTATAMCRIDLDPDQLKRNSFRIAPANCFGLRQLLHAAFAVPRWPAAVQAQTGPSLRQRLERDLVPLLIDSIARNHSHHGLTSNRSERLLIAQAAGRVMAERLTDPLHLCDLYQAIPTSRRTLVYAFNELFGLPPMRFLRLQRLHAARRELSRSQPDQTSIAATAHRFGFSSGSHFSRVYRQHFGESPLETLHGSQKRVGWSAS
ncbi:MAG: helix-turn-helix domain-containing protein [Cyanobium sp. CZS 48M]|nr:helix-turn-helix domain-containing protein [Cyanobium sp. CZS48M]